MEHSIDIKNNIASVKIVGNQNKKEALDFVDDANRALTDNDNQKVDAIVDLLDSGIADFDGLRVYKDFLYDDRLRNIAFVVTDKVVKAFTKLSTSSKGENVKFFETLEEAQKWISK